MEHVHASAHGTHTIVFALSSILIVIDCTGLNTYRFVLNSALDGMNFLTQLFQLDTQTLSKTKSCITSINRWRRGTMAAQVVSMVMGSFTRASIPAKISGVTLKAQQGCVYLRLMFLEQLEL